MDESVPWKQSSLPFQVTTLQGSDFHLEPFKPALHAEKYWASTGSDSSLYKYMSIGPYKSQAHLIEDLKLRREQDTTFQLYAIMTTRRHAITATPCDNSHSSGEPIVLAGLIGYIYTALTHLHTEIGPVIIVPDFQGLGLAVDAVKLATAHALAPREQGGWGMRRVVYTANLANEASLRVAERSGFRREGVLRWEMVLSAEPASGKVGNGKKVGGSDGIGRDTVVFAKCFDD